MLQKLLQFSQNWDKWTKIGT